MDLGVAKQKGKGCSTYYVWKERYLIVRSQESRSVSKPYAMIARMKSRRARIMRKRTPSTNMNSTMTGNNNGKCENSGTKNS